MPCVQRLGHEGKLIHLCQLIAGYYLRRTNFVSKKSVATKIKHTHVALRPFMDVGNPEPNEYYRPWLEGNIGKQGVDWDWDISNKDYLTLEIYFATQEHATLFELTWP